MTILLQILQLSFLVLGTIAYVINAICKKAKSIKDAKVAEQEKQLKAKENLDRLIMYIKDTYKDNKVEKMLKESEIK